MKRTVPTMLDKGTGDPHSTFCKMQVDSDTSSRFRDVALYLCNVCTV
jgi:hypothetical protein